MTSANVRPGKQTEAQEVSKKLVAYLKEHYTEINAQVLSSIDGSTNHWHYVDTHDSLGAFEETMNKVGEDSELQAIQSEVRDAFDMDNRELHFYRVVAS